MAFSATLGYPDANSPQTCHHRLLWPSGGKHDSAAGRFAHQIDHLRVVVRNSEQTTPSLLLIDQPAHKHQHILRHRRSTPALAVSTISRRRLAQIIQPQRPAQHTLTTLSHSTSSNELVMKRHQTSLTAVSRAEADLLHAKIAISSEGATFATVQRLRQAQDDLHNAILSHTTADDNTT